MDNLRHKRKEVTENKHLADSDSLSQDSRDGRRTRSVVVDAFKLSDVPVLHHHRQEFDDDFGVGADEDLPLTTLLRIVD